MKLFRVAALSLGLAISSFASAASFTSVALTDLNTDIRTWSDGSAYTAAFPSSQTFANVPFQLQLDSKGNDAFVGTGSLNLGVGVYGVTNVYTLINTAYGSYGAQVGSLTFHGSAGGLYQVNLVEGVNVRDHYYGSYVNTLSDATVTQAVWGVNGAGHSHLDMQNFVLPDVFRNQTLTSIDFVSNGGYSGNPFIAAATVAAVPEPETYALMALGLGALAFGVMRKRKSANGPAMAMPA